MTLEIHSIDVSRDIYEHSVRRQSLRTGVTNYLKFSCRIKSRRACVYVGGDPAAPADALAFTGTNRPADGNVPALFCNYSSNMQNPIPHTYE